MATKTRTQRRTVSFNKGNKAKGTKEGDFYKNLTRNVAVIDPETNQPAKDEEGKTVREQVVGANQIGMYRIVPNPSSKDGGFLVTGMSTRKAAIENGGRNYFSNGQIAVNAQEGLAMMEVMKASGRYAYNPETGEALGLGVSPLKVVGSYGKDGNWKPTGVKMDTEHYREEPITDKQIGQMEGHLGKIPEAGDVQGYSEFYAHVKQLSNEAAQYAAEAPQREAAAKAASVESSRDAMAAVFAAEAVPEPEDAPEVDRAAELGELSVKELRETAKDLGIEGAGGLRKAELIDAVVEAEGAEAEGAEAEEEGIDLTDDEPEVENDGMDFE